MKPISCRTCLYGLAGQAEILNVTVVTILLALVGLTTPVQAESSDFPNPAPMPLDRPARAADGSLYLPKATQRLIGMRTLPVEAGQWPQAEVLPGRVVIDPQAAGRVHASVPGRLLPGPRGLPGVGDSVQKGEVIARIEPAFDPLARSERQGQVAALVAERELAHQRLERLRSLSDTVPRRDIDAAAANLAALEGRLAADRAGLATQEALVAPVSGRIARAAAVAGQSVDPRDPLFEIIDPQRLRIEVSAHDPRIATEITGATLAGESGAITLRFIGAGRLLRDQVLPLMFEARGAALSAYAVGQPVAVTVMRGSPQAGWAVPAQAVVRAASGEAQVWVKTGPERFEPRRVATAPLDAARHRITRGLDGREIVVTEGTALLNQFR